MSKSALRDAVDGMQSAGLQYRGAGSERKYCILD